MADRPVRVLARRGDDPEDQRDQRRDRRDRDESRWLLGCGERARASRARRAARSPAPRSRRPAARARAAACVVTHLQQLRAEQPRHFSPPPSARGRPLRGSRLRVAQLVQHDPLGRGHLAHALGRAADAQLVVADRPRPRGRRATSASRSRSASGLRDDASPPADRAVRASSGSCATRRPRWMITTSSTIWATSARTWLEISTVPPSAGERAQEVAQPADPLRVEPVRRLVEHQQLAACRAARPRRSAAGACRASTRRRAAARRRSARPSRAPRRPAPPGARPPAARTRRWFRPERPGWKLSDSSTAPTVPQRVAQLRVARALDPRARPRSGATSPSSARSVVDLPAPFGPRKPVIAPARDREAEVVDRGRRAVALRQPPHLDGRRVGHQPASRSTSR